jgi:hypothetical protein
MRDFVHEFLRKPKHLFRDVSNEAKSEDQAFHFLFPEYFNP